MGMYDSIKVKEMWCCFCGSSIKDREWQTKDGECTLSVYNSFDEFGATIPKSYGFRVVGSCSQCREIIDVEILNKSEEHRLYAEEQAKKIQESLTNDCTKNHPNHTVGGSAGYKPYFWNCWCAICKEKGYEKDIANPDMDPKYRETCETKAKQDFLSTMEMYEPPEELAGFIKSVEEIGWEEAFEKRRKRMLAELINSDGTFKWEKKE